MDHVRISLRHSTKMVRETLLIARDLFSEDQERGTGNWNRMHWVRLDAMIKECDRILAEK